MKYRECNAHKQHLIKRFSCTLLGLEHPCQALLNRVQISVITQSLLRQYVRHSNTSFLPRIYTEIRRLSEYFLRTCSRTVCVFCVFLTSFRSFIFFLKAGRNNVRFPRGKQTTRSMFTF
jgi:hypothetical protein